MALIKCPECGKEISDKASFCPRCNYRIKPVWKPERILTLMWNDIGHKLQLLSKGVCLVGIAISIIGCLGNLFRLNLLGVLFSIVGILTSLISSWALYGLGLVVEYVENKESSSGNKDTQSTTWGHLGNSSTNASVDSYVDENTSRRGAQFGKKVENFRGDDIDHKEYEVFENDHEDPDEKAYEEISESVGKKVSRDAYRNGETRTDDEFTEKKAGNPYDGGL